MVFEAILCYLLVSTNHQDRILVSAYSIFCTILDMKF
jgi:hypothetical protein